MIGLNGEKMSKSDGNLVFVSHLRREGVDPAAIRLGLMADHYRSDRQWTDEVLPGGAATRGRLAECGGVAVRPRHRRHAGRGARVFGDDLDTTGALKAVDEWAAAALADTGDDAEAPMLVGNVITQLLGVPL